jgi:hypothetical protein
LANAASEETTQDVESGYWKEKKKKKGLHVQAETFTSELRRVKKKRK